MTQEPIGIAFGCDSATMNEIAELLEMTLEQMEHAGLDLDVLDAARLWRTKGEEAVKDLLEAPWAPARFREAVALAERNLDISEI